MDGTEANALKMKLSGYAEPLLRSMGSTSTNKKEVIVKRF